MEILEIVDKEGNVLGTAPRNEIHGNPALIHKVVHVLVFNDKGDLLLQKRALDKDVAPGMWDTSVGGHMEPGETTEQAALREMKEELGFSAPVDFIYKYIHSNDYETELVNTFKCVYNGEIQIDPEEIIEVRHWSFDEIKTHIDSGQLCDNFIHEFKTYTKLHGD